MIISKGNKEIKMKIKRKIIQIDEEKCTGCGQCVIACAEGAIQIVNGKAKVISDNLCDGLGACIGECPEDALHIIEREAEEFDEQAVEKHLENLKTKQQEQILACGCPSSQVQILAPETASQAANKPVVTSSAVSSLTNWPVQINLVPPSAPFLKEADLLIAADCVPVAFPELHTRFLPGRTIMIGCPKFDNREIYAEKFTAIFKTANIKSITCLIMEVPCCSGLLAILRKAKEASGMKIPMGIITISVKGEIKETRTG